MKLERQQLSEQLVLSQESLEQTTTHLKKQCGHLEDRVSELSQQNAVLHEEAEKVCLAHCVSYTSSMYACIVHACLCNAVVSSVADSSAPNWRGRGHDAH